jgi:hypothetical protein
MIATARSHSSNVPSLAAPRHPLRAQRENFNLKDTENSEIEIFFYLTFFTLRPLCLCGE